MISAQSGAEKVERTCTHTHARSTFYVRHCSSMTSFHAFVTVSAANLYEIYV